MKAFESPAPKDDSCQVWLESDQVFSRSKWNGYFLHRAPSPTRYPHRGPLEPPWELPWTIFILHLRRFIFTLHNLTVLLNPKTAGGGLNQPPPRHFPRPFRRAKFFDRAARWLFTFKSRASYDTIFAKIGHTVTTLHDFLYKLVRPKMAQKRDFVYKVNANGVFSPYS